MNSNIPASNEGKGLLQIKLRNVVVGVLVKEKTRIFLMFAYLFANSVVIYWLSTILIVNDVNGSVVSVTTGIIEKGITQTHTDPNLVLYFRLLVGSIPLIFGLLIGAPLLSTEYESGTYRFLFTQGVGRRRLVGTVLGVYFVSIALFGVMTIISVNHFLAVQQKAESLAVWSFIVFICHPIIIIPLTLTIFYAGVFLGTLIRRVIPGIAATILFALLLALGLKISLEKFLGLFAQRLYGSQEDTMQAYYGFVASNDSQYLFRFQMAYASSLTIFSFLLVFGSLRALISGGILHRKLRPS